MGLNMKGNIVAAWFLLVLGTKVSSEETCMDAIKTLRARMDTLEEENKELRKMVLESSYQHSKHRRFVVDSMESPVAFTAAISPLYINDMDPHQTIIFDKTVTDIGGAYNNVSGIFVAPRSGMYVFACSLMDHYQNGLMLHAEIVKTGNVILGRIFAHAELNAYRDQGAQTVITPLRAGDQVWVRIYDSKNLSVGGELYSTFTGFLLYADSNLMVQ